MKLSNELKSLLKWIELFFARQIQSQNSIWKVFTFIPAKLFQFVIVIKELCFNRHLIPLFYPKQLTVCVGNITMGGNGKTPFLMKLTKDLQDCHPAIFSKGYKRTSKEACRVSLNSDPAFVGDEPYMLSQAFPHVPVYVGSSREEFFRKSQNPLILLDDGLQEKSIHYAYKIAVFDKSYFDRPAYYFPMGNLRDLERSLKSVDLCAVKGELSAAAFKDIQLKCAHLTPALLISFELECKSIEPLNNSPFSFNEKSAAFCGIGYPENFYRSLRKSGIQLEKTVTLPDHAAFEEDALIKWINTCIKEGIHQVICTRKDAVKLNPNRNYPCGLFIFDVTCKLIHGKDDYDTLLLKMRKDLEKQRNQLS